MHVPAPTSFEPRRIIAKTVSGAGYDSTFVLLNTTDTFMSGMLAIGGGDVAYTIAARGVFVHEVPDNGEARVTGHAVVKPKSGATPVLSSIVSARRPDGTLRTAALWQSVEGTHFWAPVSTYPTMLRHGKIQYELDIVNEGPVPATVYLDHFDVDGMRRGRFERTLPIGTKAVLDLEHIFAVGRLRGSLRVFSDSDVALTLLKKVTNVRGELVFNDVPLQEAPEGNTRTLTFATKRERRGPRFLDRKPSRSERDVRLALLNGIRARANSRQQIRPPQSHHAAERLPHQTMPHRMVVGKSVPTAMVDGDACPLLDRLDPNLDLGALLGLQVAGAHLEHDTLVRLPRAHLAVLEGIVGRFVINFEKAPPDARLETHRARARRIDAKARPPLPPKVDLFREDVESRRAIHREHRRDRHAIGINH